MNREDELAKLIAEQKADDRDFQPPEPGVMPYGLRMELRPDGTLLGGSRDRLNDGCVIHGNEDTRADPTRGTGIVCRICDRDRKRAAYREKRAAERARDTALRF